MTGLAIALMGLGIAGCKEDAPAGGAPSATASVSATAPSATAPAASAPAATAAPSASASASASAAEQEEPPSEPNAQLANVNARYQVVNVVQGDFLNVRAEPDPKSEKVTALKPNAKKVRLTGNYQAIEDAAKSTWVEVDLNGQKGWVSRFFLAEQPPMKDPCRDAKVHTLMANLTKAVTSGDAEALVATVAPARGLMIRTNPSAKTVVFRQEHESQGFQLGRFFKNKPSGLPSLTAALTVKPGVVTVQTNRLCGRLLDPPGGQWPAEFAGLTPFSFQGKLNGKTVTWAAGIEYVGGAPFVGALVQYP